MESVIGFLVANFDNVYAIVLSVIGLASLVANMTPTETDNKIVNAVGKVVNFLAAYWRDPDAAKKD